MPFNAGAEQATMRKKTVIFNVFGHANSGDAILLESLVNALAAHRPNDEVSGIAFDVESERRWMPELVWTERIGKATQRNLKGRLMQLVGLSVAALIGLHRAWLPLCRLLPEAQCRAVEELAKADLAISCPGGYLEDSNAAYIVNTLSILLACSLSKRVVLAPQSIGPVRSRFGRWLLRKAVHQADYIFVRERESLTFVRELVAPPEREEMLKKTELVGDLAFWFDRPPTGSVAQELERLGIQPDRKFVGMTVVDWNFPHVPDPKAARERYIDSLSTLIRHVAAKQLHQIIIFNQVAHDLELGREIARRHPEIILDLRERDAGVFSKLIGSSDVFIGTRFHSCIFALIEGVSTGAIAYLPKTTGIMQDLGLDEFVIDINDVTGASLVALFESMSAQREALRARISKSLEAYRSSHDGFIRYLSEGKCEDFS